MPKYKCNNKDCILYNVVKFETAKLRIVDGNIKNIILPCPECKEDREEIKEEFTGFTTHMHGSPNISKK